MNKTRMQEYLRRRINTDEGYKNLLDYPRYFEIETVNACNARCPICTIDDWDRKAGVMSDAVFEKIASDLSDPAHVDDIIRVSLFRDGEPLLDKKLAQRVVRLKDGGVKHVSITTNVSLLNVQRATELLNAGIDSLVFSLDSLQKEAFEAIRIGLVFEEVMENALNFIQLRNRLRPNASIHVRMTRQEENRLEWPELEAFWKERLAENDRVYHHDVHNWGGQNSKVSIIENSRQLQLPCVALWSLCVILANGDVPLCNVDYKNAYGYGNVRDSSIQEIWNSEELKRRRETHLNGRKGETPICLHCNAWEEPNDFKMTFDPFADV